MKKFAALFIFCLSTQLWAANPIVKEETTPPAQNDAITLNQLPPIITGTQAPTPTPPPKQSTENNPAPASPSNTPG